MRTRCLPGFIPSCANFVAPSVSHDFLLGVASRRIRCVWQVVLHVCAFSRAHALSYSRFDSAGIDPVSPIPARCHCFTPFSFREHRRSSRGRRTMHATALHCGMSRSERAKRDQGAAKSRQRLARGWVRRAMSPQWCAGVLFFPHLFCVFAAATSKRKKKSKPKRGEGESG